MEVESWVTEQAREELQILEAQHPNRFDFLKQELQAFISKSENASFFPPLSEHLTFYQHADAASLTTQVSSNRKRKRSEKGGSKCQTSKLKIRPFICSENSVDFVIERAEACLRKIRAIKERFRSGELLL